jgi:two-component system response regulator FixJ
MQKGAVTLLEKPFDDEMLEAALDSAFSFTGMSGATSASVAAQPAPAETGDLAADMGRARYRERESSLTPREREVLGFVIQGIYNKNIADRIGLSIKTVELYRARGMAKMHARSVAELTRIMVTQQI